MPLIKLDHNSQQPTTTAGETQRRSRSRSRRRTTGVAIELLASNGHANEHQPRSAKSVPTTPVQPKSPSSIAERFYKAQTPEPALYDVYDCRAHAYGAFNEHANDYRDHEHSSSLAMITPPPPYDMTRAPNDSSAVMPRQPVPRKFRFSNREIFNMSPVMPNSSSLASAITPTKLSAAAAAIFAAPQMAQLNRTFTNLQRKHRRNSSSGDSKELDQLVLQSVDWDENEMY